MISLKDFNSVKISNDSLCNINGGKKVTLSQSTEWTDTQGGCDETRNTITHYDDGSRCTTSEMNYCC